MRPSFLQAAVAAAVTSVAVAKERKEREEGEVAASRVQSSPFLFFYLANLFVLPTLRSRSLSLSSQFTEKVLLRYHRGLLCFAHSFCLPHRSISCTPLLPHEGGVLVDTTPFQVTQLQDPAGLYRSIEDSRIEFPFISGLLEFDRSYGS